MCSIRRSMASNNSFSDGCFSYMRLPFCFGKYDHAHIVKQEYAHVPARVISAQGGRDRLSGIARMAIPVSFLRSIVRSFRLRTAPATIRCMPLRRPLFRVVRKAQYAVSLSLSVRSAKPPIRARGDRRQSGVPRRYIALLSVAGHFRPASSAPTYRTGIRFPRPVCHRPTSSLLL